MFVLPIPKRPRQMHVVNRGSSRASGKQARDPSRTPQVSLWRCRWSSRAFRSYGTGPVGSMATSVGNKQAEAVDTSNVRDLWTKITHATCYTIDTTTVGDFFGCPPSNFPHWPALSRSWSSTSPAPCHSPSSWRCRTWRRTLRCPSLS